MNQSSGDIILCPSCLDLNRSSATYGFIWDVSIKLYESGSLEDIPTGVKSTSSK
jgi:hypothetical protein